MSILLTRLLRQAEAKLAEGDNAAAETLCCQALSGAAALANAPLVAEATDLLVRIPWVDEDERGSALLTLNNKICSMQPEPIDDELALALCESLFKLTPPYPTMHTSAHNLAIFIASRLGRDRRQVYVEKLLALLDDVPVPETDPSCPIDVHAEEGPERAADILASRGAVLIRGVLDPAQFADLRDAGFRYFDNQGGQAIQVEKIGDPRPLLVGPGHDFLAKMMRRFFPVPPSLQIRQTYMRRVTLIHPETAVPFHQDVQAFGRLLVNVWTPLTACGRDAPGLELVTARLRELAATVPAVDQYDDLQISEEFVRERFGDAALYRPEMAPGDVLAFLGTTIHRTYVTLDMMKSRLSVELRFGLE